VACAHTSLLQQGQRGNGAKSFQSGMQAWHNITIHTEKIIERKYNFDYGSRQEHLESVCASVTSSSSHTIEARGLKIDMHIPHKDGSKVTNHIFDNLSRSWDI